MNLPRARQGADARPFEIGTDYQRDVDGKKREDGVRDFLASRGIDLPEGTPDDAPDADTVFGVGRRKNDLVQRLIEDGRWPVRSAIWSASASLRRMPR